MEILLKTPGQDRVVSNVKPKTEKGIKTPKCSLTAHLVQRIPVRESERRIFNRKHLIQTRDPSNCITINTHSLSHPIQRDTNYKTIFSSDVAIAPVTGARSKKTRGPVIGSNTSAAALTCAPDYKRFVHADGTCCFY